MIQLACSRLVQVVHYTDKFPVHFRIWPVGDSKNKLLEVYLFYIVFGLVGVRIWFLLPSLCWFSNANLCIYADELMDL